MNYRAQSKKLAYASDWLELAIRAKDSGKANHFDAYNTFQGQEFPNLRRKYLYQVERMEKIEKYCFGRYRKAIEEICEMNLVTR